MVVKVKWIFTQCGTWRTLLAAFATLFTVLNAIVAYEIRFSNVPSHDRGHYIRGISGVTYFSLVYSYWKDPEFGFHLDSQRKASGYSADDFPTASQRALFRFLRIGVYFRHHAQVIISFPTMLLAIPFAWRLLARYRRAPAQGDGREVPCPHCGYDMRATPDQCPECGKPARHEREDTS